MIGRFNFYDIYGYFLPGAILLGLFWLPFAVSMNLYPTAATILVATVFSYALGHVIHGVARETFSSKHLTPDGQRYPSAMVLDKDDPRLSADLKHALRKRISGRFGLDVYSGTATTDTDGVRTDAFLMCRAYVQARSPKSYSEQLQGMYALTRGAAVSCLLGVGFYLGLFFSSGLVTAAQPVLRTIAIVMGVLIFGVILLDVFCERCSLRQKLINVLPTQSLAFFIMLGLAILSGFGTATVIAAMFTADQAFFIALISTALIYIAWRLKKEADSFMFSFATGIYREFYTAEFLQSGADSNHHTVESDEPESGSSEG